MCVHTTTTRYYYCRPLFINVKYKVLDVKPVAHKGQKRKLILTEDGRVYKDKRSKLENSVKAGQYD